MCAESNEYNLNGYGEYMHKVIVIWQNNWLWKCFLTNAQLCCSCPTRPSKFVFLSLT